MPKLGGVEAAKIIKNRYKDVKVVALTGDVLADTDMFDAVLVKPCHKDTIKDIIIKYLVER